MVCFFCNESILWFQDLLQYKQCKSLLEPGCNQVSIHCFPSFMLPDFLPFSAAEEKIDIQSSPIRVPNTLDGKGQCNISDIFLPSCRRYICEFLAWPFDLKVDVSYRGIGVWCAALKQKDKDRLTVCLVSVGNSIHFETEEKYRDRK